jgi:hypothetical protein
MQFSIHRARTRRTDSVLLEAAVKRGSAEAQQKLDELAQGGCP